MSKLKPSKKKTNKPEIVAVGHEDFGYFYFQKLGYIKSGESIQIAKYESTKKRANYIIDALISRISKDLEVTREVAANYIFGTQAGDGNTVFPPDQETVLSRYPEELEQLGKFQVPTLEIHNFVTNLFLSGFYTEDGSFVPGRVAFQVELLKDIEINSEVAHFEEIPFSLENGSALKFGDIILRVDGNHDVDSEVIKIQKSPGFVQANSTGFLYNLASKAYVLGNEDWNHSDTAELPKELIDAVYDFYRAEAGLVTEEVLPEDPTPSEQLGELPALEETKVVELIGKQSTGKSKNTALAIAAS